MVAGRWVRARGGGRVWQEWAPAACPAGHPAPLPAHGECPAGCRWMGRVWKCRQEDCPRVVVDPDHLPRCPLAGSEGATATKRGDG
ncbi:hypothetical protein FHG89_14280 [Micromonospora orduensis]|uniref:Uncharacterized protein n=1 Tax=Micromonospora orduensis TaxID=1420891 RepID=A0A5C4QPQ7_9ACTN|nr:hypothetical protein [Micromonospora orduensis]TNH28801.1 hypothetical protein FHG89_14280 [Micromonospora orduensis]